MERRIEPGGRTALWLDRLVWNAAAGAALAVMILVLLASLRLLDAVSGEAHPEVSAPPPVFEGERLPAATATVNRPSG